MKVITIRQPWATLIAEGYKKYEFRTWPTKYRGDILIHAGKDIDTKHLKTFEHLNLTYPTGKILAKATITDCIQITTEIANQLNKENPLVYNFKEEWNGYGFKLDNIQKLDNPININGQLGLWNYDET